VFVTEGVRQSKMTAPKLERFVSMGRDACENDEQRRNWDRNNMLINLDNIPEDIERNIIDAYINSNPNRDKMAIYNYLIKNKCGLLLEDIEEF
jgi:hypothetical protein